MKSFSYVAILVSIAVILTGCGNKGSGAATGAPNSSALVIFSQSNTTDAWHKMYEEQLHTAVQRHANEFKFEEMDAGGDANRQSSQIEEAIAKKPKVLMVSPVSPKVVPAINKAHDAGIYVFVLDMNPASKADFYLGSSNRFTGTSVVTLYCRGLGAKRNGPILVIPGVRSDTRQWQILEGVKAEIQKGKIKSTIGPDCDDSETKAKDYVASYLKTKQPIDAIIAVTDNMAIGAGEAVKDAHADVKYIYGIGADSKATFDALRSGLIFGSVYSPPAGPQALDMIPDLLIGKFPPSNSIIGNELVRQDTMDRFLQQHPDVPH